MPGEFLVEALLAPKLSQAALATAKSQLTAAFGNVPLSFNASASTTLNNVSKAAASGGASLKQMAAAGTQLGPVLSAVTSASARAAAAAGGLGAGFSQSAAAAKKAAAAYAEAGSTVTEFGRLSGLAARRFAAFSLAVTPVFALVGALRSAAGEAVRFDLQMNKVAQVTDEGTGAVKELRGEIARLSTSLGVSSSDLADAAVQFTQAGIKATDAKKAMEAFALSLTAPNFESAKQTAEGTIAVYQQFGKDVTKLKDQLGSMNAVAGAFAVEAGDLITAVQKAGGVFSTTGGKLDELLGLMTAIRSTTRESAEQIATGLRSIFTYVQRGDTVEALHRLGIELRHTREEAQALGDTSLENQFVGPYQAVLRLSEGLAKLRTTDPRYSAIVEDLGGVRQIGRVLPLVQQFSEAQRAVNVARIGGASLEDAAAKRQDTLVSKLTKVREEYQKLADNVGQDRGFKNFVDQLANAATQGARLLEALSPLLPVIAGLAIAQGAKAATAFVPGFLSPTKYGQAAVKKADGGPITGGVPGRDSVAAALMPGEYVLRTDAVRKLGADRVAYMNKTGQIPGFAEGGPVGNKFAAEYRLNDAQLQTFLVEFDKLAVFIRKLTGASGGFRASLRALGEDPREAKRSGDIGGSAYDASLKGLADAARGFNPEKGSFQTLAMTSILNAVNAAAGKERNRSEALAARFGGHDRGETGDGRGENKVVRTPFGTAPTGDPANIAAARELLNKDKLQEQLATQRARHAEFAALQLKQPYLARVGGGDGGSGPPPVAAASPFGADGRRSTAFVADGLQAVAYKDLPAFARSLGLNTAGFVQLAGEVRQAAAEAKKMEAVFSGFSDVLVKTKGGFASVVGVVENSRSPAEKRRDRVDRIIGSYEQGAASGGVGDRFGANGTPLASPASQAVEAARRRQAAEQARLEEQRQFGAAGLSAEARIRGVNNDRLTHKAGYFGGETDPLAIKQRVHGLLDNPDALAKFATDKDARERLLARSSQYLSPAQFAALEKRLTVATTAPPQSPGFLGRARDFLSDNRLTRAAGGQSFQSLRLNPFSNAAPAAALGVAVAAPLLAARIGPGNEDAARVAAGAGSVDSYRRKSVAGGGLEGAALGASIGLSFGPVGAAAGTVAGALYGLADGAERASKELNEAKLDHAIKRLSDRLGDVANGKTLLALSDQGGIRGDIETARAASARRAEESTGSFFGAAPSDRERAAARTRELRGAFGNQAGNFASVLTTEAQRLAKANPGRSPAELTAELNTGLNKELLRLVADVREVPLGQVLKEFAKDIQDAQRNVVALESIRRAQAEGERLATSFGRLSEAVSNSLAAGGRYHQGASAAATAFGGGVPHFAGLSVGLDQLGAATGGEFRRANAGVASLLGASGGGLRSQGDAADRLARVLPSALGTLAGGGGDQSQPLGTRLRSLLESSLGGPNGLSAELSKALTVVVGQFNEKDRQDKEKGGALNEVKTDATKFAQELLAPVSEPFKQAVQKIAKDFEEGANRFVDGLAAARQQVVQIGEGRDRGFELRLGAHRGLAELRSEALGGGDPNRLLSAAQLYRPFASTQARLAGSAGEDPAAIAARLAAVRGQIQQAAEARGGASPGAFGKSAEALDRLVGEANDLQQALRNLADPVKRAAALQERLNQINSDRDSRLGFAERYVNAGPEERARLARGQRLAASLNRDESGFDRLGDQDRRLALEAARLVGGSQFANGQTGSGLATNLLKRTGVVPAGLEAERAALVAGKAQIGSEAVTAQDALTKDLTDANKSFLDNLTKLHDTFFQRLEQNLAAERLTQARNETAQNRAGRGELGTEQRQASLLAQGGITSQDTLNAARKNLPDIKKYVDTVRAIQSLRAGGRANVLGAAKQNAGDVVANYQLEGTSSLHDIGQVDVENYTRNYQGRSGFQKGFENFLTGGEFERNADTLRKRDEAIRKTLQDSGALEPFDPATREGIVGQVTGRFGKEFFARGGALKSGVAQQSVAAATINDLANSAVADARSGRLNTLEGQAREQGESLRRGGLSPDALSGLVAAQKADDFLKAAAEAFQDPAKSLDTLSTRIQTNEAQFRALGDSVTALQQRADALFPAGGKAPPVRPVPGFARGGSVFEPRGTDVVPAMLSPGEFVVNARSARDHAPLLELINGGGATQYRADGGAIKKIQDAMATASPNGWEGLYRLGEGLVKKAGEKVRGGSLNGDYKNLWVNAQLARADAARQAGAVGFEQALAGAADLPGEDEQFAAAAQRVGETEGRDSVRFRQQFSGPARQAVEQFLAKRQKEAGRRAQVRGTQRNVADDLRPLFGGQKPLRFAAGGFVPGSGAQDSVPAMLTPGEYVMNQEMLRAMALAGAASTPGAGGFGGGGGGGSLQAGGGQSLVDAVGKFSQAVGAFSQSSQTLVGAVGAFGTSVEKLAGVLEKFPTEVEHHHQVTADVNINGADAFAGMQDEFKTMMTEYVTDAVNEALDRRFPDGPTVPRG
jgi:TP901 family phage tail tape measure protein